MVMAGRSASIGTRDIDSTPPATMRSAYPATTRAAAVSIASSPEQHSRDTTPPGTRSGQPAHSAAARARSPPCSPITVLIPTTMSSTESGDSERLSSAPNN